MKTGVAIVLGGLAIVAVCFISASGSSNHKSPVAPARIDVSVRSTAADSVETNESATQASLDRPFEQARNKGPRAAAQEEVEAIQRGDVSTVARSIVFTHEARALMDSVLASAPPEVAREYPTAEQLAAFIFCGAQRIEGFRIESTTLDEPDQATQQVAYKFVGEAEWRTEEFRFMYTPNGWRRVIDVSLARRVAAIVGTRKQ